MPTVASTNANGGWRAARRDVKPQARHPCRAALASILSAQPSDSTGRPWGQIVEGVNLVTATRDPNRPFIVSAYPQREVLRRYSWRGAYGLAFFASGGTATWLIAARFG